jgi:hypothetical protein
MNKILSLLTLSLFFIFPLKIMAGGFAIHSIGGVSTNNRQLSTFWHTSTAPVITGVAVAGSTVTVSANSQNSEIIADSSGKWSYTAALGAGTHAMTFANNGATLAMNLTLGSENVDWTKASIGGNEETLPSVGTTWPTLLIFGLGLSTIVLGKKYLVK